MTRRSRIIILIVLLATLFALSSCSSLRTPCDRSDKLIEKAATLCPQRTQQGDTIVLELPSDSAVADPVHYTEADLDSALAACRDLQLVVTDSLRDTVTVVITRTVERLREAVCKREPYRFDHDLFTLTIPSEGEPIPSIILKPRKAETVCPPVITQNVVDGVSPGWRTATLCICGFILLLVVAIIIMLARSFAKWPAGYN